MKNSDATMVEGPRLGTQGKWPQGPSLAPAGSVEAARSRGASSSGARADDARCSLDPLSQTDRYRLVTPYFSSSKDL